MTLVPCSIPWNRLSMFLRIHRMKTARRILTGLPTTNFCFSSTPIKCRATVFRRQCGDSGSKASFSNKGPGARPTNRSLHVGNVKRSGPPPQQSAQFRSSPQAQAPPQLQVPVPHQVPAQPQAPTHSQVPAQSQVPQVPAQPLPQAQHSPSTSP